MTTEKEEREFKAWQDDIKRQIAESGLTKEEWVERWLNKVFGPEEPVNAMMMN
jgi:hypothetical protein